MFISTLTCVCVFLRFPISERLSTVFLLYMLVLHNLYNICIKVVLVVYNFNFFVNYDSL